MIAIDTNVVVRYLVDDDPAQAARARALVDSNQVFVPLTVMLETEWVLKSAYAFPIDVRAAALLAFAGLPSVTIEDATAMARALGWAAQGVDFADGLHLAKSEGCEAFATFDAAFAKAARSLAAPDTPQVRVP
jgi:predicted nucleic-acid-binding protein